MCLQVVALILWQDYRTLAQPDIGSANRASGLLTYTNTDSDAALQCCDVIVA